MNNFFKEFADDFVALSINVEKAEIGVRIRNPASRHSFDKLPEHLITNTTYNRQTLKWFRYEGIDVSRREIKFYSRLRVMVSEGDKLIRVPARRDSWRPCDQTASNAVNLKEESYGKYDET